MRILLIDIDTLRPDHLGCYGYRRNTSPNIDKLAAKGVRFDRVYASDTPCLPSRTALISGRFGIHTGAINHGGAAADPFVEGSGRDFRTALGKTSYAACLRRAGLRTATVSSFGERHSAWHWYAGFQDVINVGEGGLELADTVVDEADAWLDRHAARDDWFLHVHLWDPHTPYRAPPSYGEPFARDPVPGWLTEEVRAAHWNGYGPHSAREATGFDVDPRDLERFPRQPVEIDSPREVRRMFDGYDTGVRYADDAVGRLMRSLETKGLLDDTAVIVTSDHGENLGELNVYCDHQTADEFTARIPMIVKWPGLGPGIDRGFHYHVDVAATVVELLGVEVPPSWDGKSFAGSLRIGAPEGREHLVLSQAAWTCQRAVRWQNYLCIRTYHDGYHDFAPVMLFDLEADRREQADLSTARPDIVAEGLAKLEAWHAAMLVTATTPHDPMWTVIGEGGPHHTRGALGPYLDRLRATGRAAAADALVRRHGRPRSG